MPGRKAALEVRKPALQQTSTAGGGADAKGGGICRPLWLCVPLPAQQARGARARNEE